ncbi:MAG: histidine phosphatase family protein [Candidatus Omnitrophota bacterium]|nr:histidine phosphatase family protein [Candidatus Omnitrophota bacterium]
MDNTLLYFVRHGQTVWNKEKRWQGWQDSPLTTEGVAQTKAIAQRLKDEKFDLFLTSPLGRAVITAGEINKFLNIDVTVCDELKEINLGDLEGHPEMYMRDKFPDEFLKFWNQPDKFLHPSAETFTEVRDRVMPFVKDLYGKYKKVLIVTHTTVIKHIIVYYLKRNIDTFWGEPVILPCSLTVCNMSGREKAGFDIIGDISHYGDMNRVKDVKY